MSNKLKKFRQTSLIESFAFIKRQKTSHTPVIENTEFEIATSSKRTSEMMASKNSEEIVNSVCQAAENSVAVRGESGKETAKDPSLDAETDEDSGSMKNSDDLFPEESGSYEDYSAPSHSGELFVDSVEKVSPEEAAAIQSSDTDELDELSFLNRTPDCSLPLPKMEPLENHTILFSIHSRPGEAPHPFPPAYKDKWDSDHVRMPCSPLNRFPVENGLGEKHIESRWNLICHSLRRNIDTSKDLEDAIMKYNSQYIGKWNFLGLHNFINKHLTEEEREHFFEVILPVMIEMALDLPNICTQPIPLLKKGIDHSVTLSQKQIAFLLLNAFFCTFPRRNLPNKRSKQRWSLEYASYPDINFNRLFYGTKSGIPRCNAEKLKCLFNYFRRIISKEPIGTVTFHRQSLRNGDLPRWPASNRGIRTAVIHSAGLIEREGSGMLQVDFANKYVGGGVLGQGCVQEEIRFIICPELIVSRLFVECLGNNEALTVTGVEQYNQYSGYADNFKWEGNFKDETPRDSWGRRYTQLVAMDATHFRNPEDQFKCEFMKRELNKAYCAFYESAVPAHLCAVATGNWGCGAFKGNPNLKFLIQLMAASQTSRSLLYLTFGNRKLKKQLRDMYEFLCDRNLSVGDVWRLLIRYSENVSLIKKDLYDFIYAQFSTEADPQEESSLDDSDERAIENLVEDVLRDGSPTEIDVVT